MALLQGIVDLLTHVCVLCAILVSCDAESCPKDSVINVPTQETTLCTNEVQISPLISVYSNPKSPSCTCIITVPPSTRLRAQVMSDSSTCDTNMFVITHDTVSQQPDLCDKSTCQEYNSLDHNTDLTLGLSDSNSGKSEQALVLWLEGSTSFKIQCGYKQGLRQIATTPLWLPSGSVAIATTLMYGSSTMLPSLTPSTSVPSNTPSNAPNANSNPVQTTKAPHGGFQTTQHSDLVNQNHTYVSNDTEHNPAVSAEYWNKIFKSRPFLIGVIVGGNLLLILMITTAIISYKSYRRKMSRLRKGSQRGILAPGDSNDGNYSDIRPNERSDYGSVFHVTEQGSNDFQFTY